MSQSISLRTPTLIVNDCQGLTIRQVAYMRTEAGGNLVRYII